MQKLLKSTAIEPAPGAALGASRNNLLLSEDESANADDVAQTPGKAAGSNEQLPLIKRLEQQKRNLAFANSFNIPITENLLDEVQCTVSISGTQQSNHRGNGYLSDSFFCFSSDMAYQCGVVIPFFTVKRVEKSIIPAFLTQLCLLSSCLAHPYNRLHPVAWHESCHPVSRKRKKGNRFVGFTN